MKYKIEFREEKEILIVEFSGYRTLEDSLELWDIVANESKTRNKRKLLLISHLSGDFPQLDAYRSAEALANKLNRIVSKIAYADLSEKSYTGVKFGELVAVNRGIRGVVFRSVEEALSYLKE